MSRSNNRIPKQFLIDTYACKHALHCWRRNITAEKIVKSFATASESCAHNLPAGQNIRLWIKGHYIRLGNPEASEYWFKVGRADEPELLRHCIRRIKTWLKEWRNAKLSNT